MGDSTGIGVGAHDHRGYVVRLFERIKMRESDARLLNLCTKGATSWTVRHVQLPRLRPESANLITVFVGANDLWWESSAQYVDNMGEVSSQLRNRADRRVLCTLPNLAHAPAASLIHSAQRAALEARIEAINEQLRALARNDQHLLVDLASVGLADRAHFFCADGFHPSAQGYEALAEEIWRALSAP